MLSRVPQRGEFGLLCQDNPRDPAEKTLIVLRDPRRGELMGQRRRELAEREFRWEQISARLSEFYQRTLHRN